MVTDVSSLVFIQYLTTVFDNIGDSILLIGVEPDAVFRLLLANESFFRTTGYTKEQIGKTVQEVVSPESYRSLIKHYGKVIHTKKPLQHSEWFNTPRGLQAYDSKFIPVVNAVGEVVQIAVIGRDITELQELRDEVQRLRAELHNIHAHAKAAPAPLS